MKYLSCLICLFLILGHGEVFSQKNAEDEIETARYDLSYAYGLRIGASLRKVPIFTEEEKDADQFIEGFQDALIVSVEKFEKAKSEMKDRIQSNVRSITNGAAHKVAYNIGLTSGLGEMAQKIDIPITTFDYQGMKKGYICGLTEENPFLEMTQEKIDVTLKTYLDSKIKEYQKKMQEEKEAEITNSIKIGEDFLLENKNKEGVVTTKSGLQYEVIKEGSGVKSTTTDRVKVHYHGTLIDGTVFDSSIDRGEPSTFGINQVIKGWQEGILLMSEGAKYRFYIPQELAYGMRSPTSKMPAGSTLIFEVELIKINPE